MHTRHVLRNPAVCRAARAPARNMSVFGAPSFYPARYAVPSFPSWSHDFAPLIRLLDETTSPFESFFKGVRKQTFQPRFDVKEVDDAYQLHGELPGVEAKDLEVEFKDDQTLVIRGKTARESTSGTPPAAIAEPTEQAEAGTSTTNAVAQDDAASEHSGSTSSYQKATVEDEADEGRATPAESAAEEPAAESSKQGAAEAEAAPEQPKSTYWVSERSVGSFQRVFNFPSRVDQDGVKASLKNGVLEILVPKAAEPAARRINVE